MELFFVVAGFLAAMAVDRGLLSSLEHQARRLLIPHVLWVSLYVMLEAVFWGRSVSLGGYLSELRTSGFWFLREMFLVLVAYDVYALIRKRIGVLPALIAFFVLCRAFQGVSHRVFLIGYAVYFVIGYVLGLSVGTPKSAVETEKVNLMSRGVVWCGKNSLGLYAVHWVLCFYLFNRYVFCFRDLVVNGWNTYLVSALVFVLWTVFSVALILLMNKVKWLRVLFLGTK